MTEVNKSFAGVRESLSQDGCIARNLSGFESRPEQVQMALAVEEALGGGGHLVVEAGTGVGKSFAYLVPVVGLVGQRKGPVLISTFTITLQEQLINKDIPLLAECLGVPFTAVLAKGRGNYLCKRRLEFARRGARLLFDKESAQLDAINNWAARTKDGSLSDLGFVPRPNVWAMVTSEHGNCRGRSCGHFGDCFYRRARRRLDSADIAVANHALLFSDLVLKEQGASVLPEYKYVVIDEAHNMEHVAEEHFGTNISEHAIRLLLSNLYNPRTRRGLLAYRGAEKAIETTEIIARYTKEFFKRVGTWYEQEKNETGGRCHKGFVEDTISGHLNELRRQLTKLGGGSDDTDEKFEFVGYANRCGALVKQLQFFIAQENSEYVYWVERSGVRQNITLRSAPLNVGPDVKRCLFDKYESVIMTSATLSSARADGSGGFEFFTGRVGLENYKAIKLGSPFDYQKQVTMYVEKTLPDPNDAQFQDLAAEAIKKYVRQTAGRAFVLFTSYDMLEKMAGNLSSWLKENDIELLQQGTGLERTALLGKFKSGRNCVLFGTDSFWQGVDVPGEALSNVIIVRLPFGVPDQPLLAGRCEQIKEQGGNPFQDYQLPCAILKFKQGFGRLIRSKTDTGIVVVLDSRIITKPYGRQFLAAVPKCRMEIVRGAG